MSQAVVAYTALTCIAVHWYYDRSSSYRTLTNSINHNLVERVRCVLRQPGLPPRRIPLGSWSRYWAVRVELLLDLE